MGGRRGELARWRPCETAAAGGAHDGQGESARAGASNSAGGQGAGRAGHAERAVHEQAMARAGGLWGVRNKCGSVGSSGQTPYNKHYRKKPKMLLHHIPSVLKIRVAL